MNPPFNTTNQQLVDELADAHATIASLKQRFSQPRFNDKFQHVVDVSPVPHALNDKQQNIIYLNSAFTSTFGYELSDIPTLNDWWPKAYPDPEYRQWIIDTWRQHLERAIKDNRPFESMEVKICCKDNSEKTVIISATSLDGDSGNTHLVTLFDISQSRHFEQQLHQTVTLLENVINSTPDLIFVKDSELKTILCNESFAHAMGRCREDMYGKSDIENGWNPDLVQGKPEDGVRGFIHDDLDALSGMDVHNPNDPANINGEIRVFDTHKRPLKDEEGNIFGVLGIARDVTERIHVEEQLRRSQKMDALGKLTGGIAHDFNNMLGVILGYTELLEEKLADEPQSLRYLKSIMTAGNRARTLTSKLLTFARKQPSEKKHCNINTLLQSDQHILKKSLTARINLQLHLDKALYATCIDKNMLSDAIFNISINSLHAMPDGGELIICTQNCHITNRSHPQLSIPPGDYIQLSFSDTGSGISADIKEKVFEPFFTTKGESGTGLGLSQVYGFVKQFKGDIQIQSEIGKGTQIRIYLPRSKQQTENTQSDSAIKPLADLYKNETILLVDDEPDLRELASEILSRQNYRVIQAENTQDALKILQTETIDLLLTDVIMPGTDGYQLASQVSVDYPEIKILIASGYSEDTGIQKKNTPVYPLLQKPYNSRKLLESIRELLDG